jgi:hypothetical protein
LHFLFPLTGMLSHQKSVAHAPSSSVLCSNVITLMRPPLVYPISHCPVLLPCFNSFKISSHPLIESHFFTLLIVCLFTTLWSSRMQTTWGKGFLSVLFTAVSLGLKPMLNRKVLSEWIEKELRCSGFSAVGHYNVKSKFNTPLSVLEILIEHLLRCMCTNDLFFVKSV